MNPEKFLAIVFEMNTIERTSLLLNREELVFTVGFDYIKDNLLAYGLLQCESLEDIENQVIIIA